MKLTLPKTLRTALLVAVAAMAGSAALGEDLKVRLGYPTALHGEIAKVLEKTDIGKKHGLAIEATFFQYGPPQIEALAAKSLDVAFTSLVPTANFLNKQPGAVKVITALGTSEHGLIVPTDSPVKSLADFKGKTIAVAFGTDSHVDLLAALHEAGLDPRKDVKLNNVPPNEQPTAFEQRLADGVLVRQPQLLKYLEKGAREIQRWPHHLWAIARAEFLSEHPDAQEKLIAAIREASLFVAQNPEQSAKWFAEQLRADAATLQRVSVTNPLYKGVKELKDVKIEPSAELKEFAARRAAQLVEFGVSKKVAEFSF